MALAVGVCGSSNGANVDGSVDGAMCAACVMGLAAAMPAATTTSPRHRVWDIVTCAVPLLPANVASTARQCVALLLGTNATSTSSSSSSSTTTTTTTTSSDAAAKSFSFSSSSSEESAPAPEVLVTAQAAAPAVMVAYSSECAALHQVQSGVFNTAWLPGGLVACMGGVANITTRPSCDTSCLLRLRNAVTALRNARCDEQYFTALAGVSSARGGGPDVAAAARADFAAQAWLLTSQPQGRLDLACQRNAAGDMCLAYTGLVPSLPAMHAGSSHTPPGDGADAGAQCAWWRAAGCCAPMMAALRQVRTQTLNGDAPSSSIASLIAETTATVHNLGAVCSALTASSSGAPAGASVATAPCGAADAFLAPATGIVGAPPPAAAARVSAAATPQGSTSPSRNSSGISGGAVAGIVIAVLLVVGGCAGALFFVSRRRARQDVYHAFEMHQFSRA